MDSGEPCSLLLLRDMPYQRRLRKDLLVCDVDRCFVHPANQALQRSRGVAISMHLFTHQPEFHGHRAACSLTASTPQHGSAFASEMPACTWVRRLCEGGAQT